MDGRRPFFSDGARPSCGPMPARNTTRLLLLLGGLLIWSWISWPLPRHCGRAIPWTDRVYEGGSRVRELVPGDHLQLYAIANLEHEFLGGTRVSVAGRVDFAPKGTPVANSASCR